MGNLIIIGLVLGMLFIPIHPTSSKTSMDPPPTFYTTSDLELFSEGNLVQNLKEMNFKFAHIVYAQAILETGNFSSLTFLEGNNLFGMRRAKGRITTAVGDYGSYAQYKTWLDSLIDYGFYQSKYLSRINNEEEYYEKLQSNYASDPDYIIKLQKIVKSQKLKLLFKKQTI
jgi:flagellum-specific peptidoglycan hydrolase FlgJ